MDNDGRRMNGNVIDIRTAARALRQDKGDAVVHQDDTCSAVSTARRIVTIKRHPVVKAAMNGLPSWITPNGITYFRTLLVIPVVYLLLQEMFFAALGTLAVSMLLDAADGALAEARQMQSEFGAFLDPLADKIVVCTTLLVCLKFLPQTFVTPVTIICFFATMLTMVRVVRMAKKTDATPWLQRTGQGSPLPRVQPAR